MLRDAVRGVVVVAAEFAEEAGRRVLGAAEGLLQRGGVDVAAVEARLGGQFPPSAEQLRLVVTEAVTAGRAGVDLVTGVARSEAEQLFERVGDQVMKVGVVLSFLESKLREVHEDEQPPASKPEGRAGGLFEAGWESAEPATGWAEPDAEWAFVPEEPFEPEGFAESADFTALGDAPGEAPAKKSPAKRAAKSTAAKSTTAKTTAKKTAAKKTAAEKPAAKKASAGKTAAKRTTTAKSGSAAGQGRTTAKRTVARQSAAGAAPAAGRKAAAKKTVVRKSTGGAGRAARRKDADD
ncbi:hypothetical protein [Kitasatospora cinereorecta]|uniref:Histone n=1 Tax=Kitasatospora cinereorecta TaxID=285560 RepID=A0ABW0VN78_9ACTN